MASLDVTSFLIVRIVKSAIGNPTYEWTNTYEVSLGAPTDDNEMLEGIIDGFADGEETFHTTNVQFVRGSISTWVADETPYDPESFFIKEFENKFGNRPITTHALPRFMVLQVRRSVARGRSGKLFYRGVLDESDMETSSAFLPALTVGARTELQGSLSTMYTSASTAVTAAGGPGSSISMLRFTGPGSPEQRGVTGFIVRGITAHDPDHKYFDVAP